MMKERRKYVRYHTLFPVRYHSDNNRIVGYSLTKDLSREGLGIPSDTYLPPRSKLNIEISIPQGQKISAKVVVVWSKRNKNSWEPLYSSGLKFEEIDLASLEKLIDIARQHQWQKSDYEKSLEENSEPALI